MKQIFFFSFLWVFFFLAPIWNCCSLCGTSKRWPNVTPSVGEPYEDGGIPSNKLTWSFFLIHLFFLLLPFFFYLRLFRFGATAFLKFVGNCGNDRKWPPLWTSRADPRDAQRRVQSTFRIYYPSFFFFIFMFQSLNLCVCVCILLHIYFIIIFCLFEISMDEIVAPRDRFQKK